jgi:uncharacterized protein YdeI (YjbR/CyaY-like superfamily)
MSERYDQVTVRSRAEWRRWLAKHHASSQGVWAVTYRKDAAGKMMPAGLTAIDVSKANGNWEGLDAIERLEEPEDLRAALDARPKARAAWDKFPRSTKRAILEWISTAKKPETRGSRVAETVSEAAVGRRANQWRQPSGRSAGGAGTGR